MIYFDNAATTLPKPEGVIHAVSEAMATFGGVGRGVHEAALQAGMAVYGARNKIAKLFNAPSARTVVFSANATSALNIAIFGLLQPGDHVITTAASHNSVLRPLYLAGKQGNALSILPVARNGSINYNEFDALFTPATRMAVVTHASNLTGDVYNIARMAEICHSHNALIVVDAAQTAGVFPIDVRKMGIDVLVFTGHKSLFGPQGTGGMVVAEGVEIRPMFVGGSGTHSFDKNHPAFMPERLEAGTLNAHGIAGLRAGIEYLVNNGIAEINERVQEITDRFEEGVKRIDGIKVYGGHADIARCGIVALNFEGQDSGLISDILNTDFGICTRPGAHCAPLMHEALETAESGLVRFSFSHLNALHEVDLAIEALEQIAARLKAAK